MFMPFEIYYPFHSKIQKLIVTKAITCSCKTTDTVLRIEMLQGISREYLIARLHDCKYHMALFWLQD